MKQYCVYILTNFGNDILYIGCTSNLEQRMWQHNSGKGSSFVQKYNGCKLIYHEECPNSESMITREKQLKGWTRAKKEKLISTINPEWHDIRIAT